ncbi:plant specific eukaryotic initiation factor 4B [Aureococcus anophagefferens]|uniref:Plant specific eukaryotic initiation factor 4B n=2 Tax=Aureococcus anophagefferens TaxID=44056 RepID=A0ABR1FWM0_AURAN|nr:plant specific eukaryotic initiation factor 4B [Aureococcus anophagefferens]
MASYESSPEAVPAGRPKLMLKKRDPAAAAKAAAERSASASGKPNPFGAARPREETLKAKGVDVKLMDKKIEAKTTSTTRMTRQQREEADQLSQAVREAEDALREANENEMPENALRETLAAKRKILNDFMEQVAAANMQKVGGAPGM